MTTNHWLELSSFASFDSSFEIDLWKIESGLEKRTTCMIRNIPNKYTQVSLLGRCFLFKVLF